MKMMGIIVMGLLNGKYVNITFVLSKDYRIIISSLIIIFYAIVLIIVRMVKL